MTKADVLAGAKGKPTEFTFEEFKCLLRPLTFGERRELFEWHEKHKDEAGSGMRLQEKFLLYAVCDETGKKLLDEVDLDDFAGPIADAVAKEVARRNGLDGKAGGEQGNGLAPTKS